MSKWVCRVCGYETEAPESPEECPICGQGRDAFDLIKSSLDGDFKTPVRQMTMGIYVVTSSDGTRLNGQTANSIIQGTSEPTQVIAILNKSNLTTELVQSSLRFGVNVMGQDSYETVAAFGFVSGRDKDKFATMEHQSIQGVPMLTQDALSGFTCEVVQQMDIGTHILFVGVVNDGFVNPIKAPIHPMSYEDFRHLKKGEGLGVTTREDNKPNKREGRYVCDVCGWIYDLATIGVPFEDQPEDYVCPICGAGKDRFRAL